MNTPKLSVVIPCFNHGQYLREAIASVTEANRSDVEIIVVDDGSTDSATRQVLKELATEGLRVISKQNGGPASARNAGIKLASGEYILTLDADNRIRKNYIEHGIRILDSQPKAGVVYGDAEYMGIKQGRWVMGEFDLKRLLILNYIDNCAVFRKQVWIDNGGYDTGIIWGLEDWDFWLTTVSRGWEFVYVPEVLFDYRVARRSLVTTTIGREAEAIDFITRKHGALHRSVLLNVIADQKSFRRVLKRLMDLFWPGIKRRLSLAR